ncbi:hypothetical protein [Ruminococcus sp. HUN007]|uniref:hypothetical protein n=1 Tax=Ruminococcus sp. HUN007 TaxID=1514668 RepID=UPI0005D251EF|nr:hypothetical protein [Ruminococcus sp. HUN007]
MKKIKRIISTITSFSLMFSLIGNFPISNAENEKFQYTLFAGSESNGALTINAENFCINGNMATNGSVVHGRNFNVNGINKENANVDMIYMFNKIETRYFSTETKTYSDDYALNSINIDINSPISVKGKTDLTGNININNALKSIDDIMLNGEVKNSNNALVFSRETLNKS